MFRESALVFANEDVSGFPIFTLAVKGLAPLLVVHVNISCMCVSVGHSLKDVNTKATTLFIY